MIEGFEDMREYILNKVKVDALMKEIGQIEKKTEMIKTLLLRRKELQIQQTQPQMEYIFNQIQKEV